MFRDCSSLISLDLRYINTENVERMDEMFKGCVKLTSFDLSQFKISSLNNMEYMFDGCSSLNTIDLSNINAPKLINMASMFNNCSELSSVNLSNFTTSVNNMTNIFKGCTNLIVLDISGFNFKNIISNNSLFEEFNKLRYFNIKGVEFDENNNDIKIQFQDFIDAKKGMIICQNNETTINPSNIYKCCNFIIDVDTCESFNFIIAKYGSNSNYNSGFTNLARRELGIEYIKYGDKLFKPTDKLNIEANTSIEIYCSEEIKNLSRMFSSGRDNNMKNIISIDFSNLNTSLVTDMMILFYGCEKLASINFTNFNTEQVENMYGMFSNCKTLTSVDLTNFNTSKVTDIGFMFEECQNLKYIDLRNFDTSLVTNMRRMFYNCKSTTFIDISSFNMQNVESYDQMFEEVNNLKYVNLYNVEDFKGIITSSDLNKMNNLTVCQKDILITNELAINKCCYFNNSCDDSALNLLRIIYTKNIEYPNGFGKDNIKYIIDKDHYNPKKYSNESVNFIAGNRYEIYFDTEIEKLEDFFKSEYFPNSTEIKSIDVICPNSTSFEGLESMFQGCSSLESVSLNMDTSKVISFKTMFGDCSSLTSLDLRNFNTEKVERMDEMFKGCVNLTSLDLSQFKTSSLNNMDYMFDGCSSLIVLDICNFYMKNDNIENEAMFRGLTNLKYLNLLNIELGDYDLSETDLNSLANLIVCSKYGTTPFSNITSKIFRCCETPFDNSKCKENYILVEYSKNFTDKLIGFITRNIEINKSLIYLDDETDYVKNIETMEIKPGSKLKIEFSTPLTTLENFFYNMTKIKSIDFSHFDPTEITDMSCLFYHSTGLENITFGDNFNTKKLTNISGVFYGCSSLTSIDLSQFNTELVDNMSYLFSGCNSLESINFSNINTSSVVDMSNMFYNCRSLKLNELSNFNTKKVTNMSFMFYGCKSLQYLNLTNFNTSSLLNMKSMFRNSNSLVTLDISTFNTRKVTTMAYLFAGCSQLKNLYHLSVLDSPSVIDRIGMYDGCYSLFSPDNPDFRESYNGSLIPNDIVLLGFNNYTLINNKKITFNIYFYSYEYFEFPQLLYLSASIIYNSQLRLLQNENNVECLKGEETLNDVEKYVCGIDIENSDIKTITLGDSIDFGSENNLIISPLALEYMDNLQSLENIDSFDDLFDNATIFILQNSNLAQSGKTFNVSGEMNDDPQLPIGKKITLLVLSEKEQTKEEINCSVADNDTKKYTLNCSIIDNNINYDLNNSISVMDNNILMINFENGNSITNNSDIDKSDTNKSKRNYYFKSKSGISSGAIVAIILCPILALVSVIAIILCSKKNNIKKQIPGIESSSRGIKLNN